MQYQHANMLIPGTDIPVFKTNIFMSYCAFGLMAAQLPFIINFFWTIFKGQHASANHWHATTLEWAAATSPPLGHGNFEVLPVVYRGPYEYSSPECTDTDYLPQNVNLGAPEETPGGGMLPAHAVAQKEL
jgi:cytochrome c oxidase subunit 1